MVGQGGVKQEEIIAKERSAFGEGTSDKSKKERGEGREGLFPHT